MKRLGREYLVLSLLNAKEQIFDESFVTLSELNQFHHFLQNVFNKKGLDIVIDFNILSSDDFNMVGGVIMVHDNCCLNVDRLPANVLSVLYDVNLIANFLMQLEHKKLEILCNVIDEAPKLH